VLQVRSSRLPSYSWLCEDAGSDENGVLVNAYERFIDDLFIHGTAERNLHLAIECLLDIGNHVISDRGFPKPESYADIFRILNEQSIIPDHLLSDLKGMAAFRNVLVHNYLLLDRTKVYQIISEKRGVVEELAGIYAEML
jgi:uncharacterized protein YutE (UPF0331/DUF86 family)